MKAMASRSSSRAGMDTNWPNAVGARNGENRRYEAVSAVARMFCAHIICGPEYGLNVWKM